MTEPPDPSHPSRPGDPDAALAEALQRSRVMVDAPESLIQRAIDVFVARPQPAATPPSVLRRWVALLAYDSSASSPLAAGLRSGGGATRQLLFSAEGRDVDLRIGPVAGGWQLSGQVLGPDAQGSIEFACGDFRVEQAWNALAEFHLDGLPAGRWQILLRSDSWELVLPDLQVPGEPA